jgi:hypothetical protein
VFIEGKGSLPADPVDERKVVLEEERAVDSETVRALRKRLFGNWEMNWVGFNYARDFTLPGKKRRTDRFSDVSLCRISYGPVDSLDPASFAYSILRRRLSDTCWHQLD